MMNPPPKKKCKNGVIPAGRRRRGAGNAREYLGSFLSASGQGAAGRRDFSTNEMMRNHSGAGGGWDEHGRRMGGARYPCASWRAEHFTTRNYFPTGAIRKESTCSPNYI
ncbi:hypothetical protein VTH06DRAFT_6521 [Thermothelomyces fergusii]